MQPDGVQGRRPGLPWASRPALTGVSPSTSLRGSIIVVSAPPSTCFGVGSCSRMPLTSGSSLRLAIVRSTSACVASWGSVRSIERIPTSTVWRRLLVT